MRSFLPYAFALTAMPLFLASLSTGCGDDTTTTQSTSSSTSSGMGGTTTTTTSTSSSGGTGGVGGTGGTGGMPPMACMGPKTGTDTCDGEVITLTQGTNLSLCGEITESNNDDYQDPFCPAASAGGDNVYDVAVTQPGTFRVKVERDLDSTLNPTLYFRLPGSCTDGSLGVSGGCYDFFPDKEEICDDWDPTFLPGFHLFVDGGPDGNGPSTTGDYVLSMSLEAAACGDGVINFTTNEECDDGNTTSGDGCSSTCEAETNSLFDLCNGEPLFPAQGLALMGTSNTNGYGDDYIWAPTASCQGTEVGGHDRVYRVTPQISGTLTATVGLGPDCQTSICASEGTCAPGCWDYVLWATDANDCGNALNQLDCSDDFNAGPETISFPVTAASDYHIFVDGYDAFEFGTFNLCIDIQP